MNQRIAYITLVVDDYDKAIKFYTEKLDFILIENTILSEEKRWVLVAPKSSDNFCFLLARAANKEQRSRIGNQTGGRVFIFLHTDNFWRDYHKMVENKINFTQLPRKEEYGTVAVFEDLYGNLWDLIEPKIKSK